MYTISCESTVDLNWSHLEERGLPVIAYTYIFDGVEYFDDLRKGDGLKLFYEKLTSGKQPSTSLINTERYVDFFRPFVEQGDLLHIAFGSGLSQSCANAIAAAEILKKQYPDRKIYVVDSLCACVGYGLFTDMIADRRDSGASIDQLYEWAMANRLNVIHQFYSTTLTYFRRSGRISGPAALIGNILKLCPIMHLDGNGKIVAYSKVMSESKAMERTLAEVARKIADGKDYNGKLWIGHSDCIKSAQKMYDALHAEYPNADIRIYDIGPVIASHCGPGTVAIFFCGESRSK